MKLTNKKKKKLKERKDMKKIILLLFSICWFVNVNAQDFGVTIRLIQPLKCNGGNDAIITAFPDSAGTYTYLWNDPASTTAATVTNLLAGTYSVDVTDLGGNTVTETFTVPDPTPISVVVDSKTNSDYFPLNNGSINITVSGGNDPYQYQWVDSIGINTYATRNLSNIEGIPHHLTVIDENGCTYDTIVPLGQNNSLNVTQDIDTTTCFGRGTASTLKANVSPGQYPLDYSSSIPGEDISGVLIGDTLLDGTSVDPYSVDFPEGRHWIQVVDKNGVGYRYYFKVTQKPTPLSISETHNDITCNGDNDGRINISPDGGYGIYIYDWSDGSTDQNRTDLDAGVYRVTVRDSNECSISKSINIIEPNPIQYELQKTDVDCNGNNTGRIEITNLSGGTGAYTIAWDTGSDSLIVDSLVANTYTVDISDENSCLLSKSATINEPTPLSIVFDQVDSLSCFESNDGVILTTISGGTPSYDRISWNKDGVFFGQGLNLPNIAMLEAGNYTINVTDKNGCFIAADTLVGEPNEINLNAWINNAPCNDQEGRIGVEANNTAPPYTYDWYDDIGNFIKQDVWTNLNPNSILDTVAGTYQVVVTDARGCIKSQLYKITEPKPLNLAVSNTPILCYDSTSTVRTMIEGGTIGENTELIVARINSDDINDTTTVYRASNSYMETITGLVSGEYIFYLTDNNGCGYTATKVVNQPDHPIISVASSKPSYCANDNGELILEEENIQNYSGYYNISWRDLNDNEVGTGNYVYDIAPGNYYAETTDENGCIGRDTVVVDQIMDDCLVIPDVITPYEVDGFNDCWVIEYIEMYPNCKISIFSQWEGEVFSTTNGYNNDWCGTGLGGSLLPSGEYTYLIKLGIGYKPITGVLNIISSQTK